MSINPIVPVKQSVESLLQVASQLGIAITIASVTPVTSLCGYGTIRSPSHFSSLTTSPVNADFLC